MNKIFKSFFNKRKKCYVVASEKCSVTRKGSAKTIALIIPIVALASPQSAYSVTFGGYVNHTNGVYEDADGNKLLNLQNYCQKAGVNYESPSQKYFRSS